MLGSERTLRRIWPSYWPEIVFRDPKPMEEKEVLISKNDTKQCFLKQKNEEEAAERAFELCDRNHVRGPESSCSKGLLAPAQCAACGQIWATGTVKPPFSSHSLSIPQPYKMIMRMSEMDYCQSRWCLYFNMGSEFQLLSRKWTYFERDSQGLSPASCSLEGCGSIHQNHGFVV